MDDRTLLELYLKKDPRAIEESLFAYGYPQFDFCVPAILQRIERARARGEGRICVELPAFTDDEQYLSERAERFSWTWGVELEYVRSGKRAVSKRALKRMEKSIDAVLKDFISDSACVLHGLGADVLDNAKNEKDAALRVRKKALLCQTVTWLEKFNVVLV